MSFNSNYIKDIETFFLRHRGNGVMLSSRDYNLIKEWQNKGIPKEIVFKGISNAIEDDAENIKNLYKCGPFVYSLYRAIRHSSRSENEITVTGKNGQLERIFNKIDVLLLKEKRENVKQIYLDFRYRILQLSNRNADVIFSELNQMEYEFFDKCFHQLSYNERSILINEAESMIPKNARFISKNDRNDSITAFRNELIVKKYSIVNIFEYD